MVRKIRIRLSFAQEVLPTSYDQSSIPSGQDQNQTQQTELRIYLDEVIFTVSCISALLLLQLPMEYIDEKPVPTVIFKGHPSIFHAFLICLMGSCFGSVCSIHLRERKPKVARFYYLFGVASMVLSFAIFLWVVVPASFMWVAFKFLPIS